MVGRRQACLEGARPVRQREGHGETGRPESDADTGTGRRDARRTYRRQGEPEFSRRARLAAGAVPAAGEHGSQQRAHTTDAAATSSVSRRGQASTRASGVDAAAGVSRAQAQAAGRMKRELRNPIPSHGTATKPPFARARSAGEGGRIGARQQQLEWNPGPLREPVFVRLPCCRLPAVAVWPLFPSRFGAASPRRPGCCVEP